MCPKQVREGRDYALHVPMCGYDRFGEPTRPNISSHWVRPYSVKPYMRTRRSRDRRRRACAEMALERFDVAGAVFCELAKPRRENRETLK